ncbi:MAG: YgfZ/GcvT domain-containing protein [Prochlorococcaceae cyanobacterium]
MDPVRMEGLAAGASPWSWAPEQPSRLERSAGLLRLEGPDALRVLHGQTSQAIEGAAAGAWRSSCAITATARMRALADVLVDRGGAWLVIHGAAPEPVRAALDRVLVPADRVELGPLLPARLLTPLEPAGAAPDPAPGPPGQWQPLDAGGDGIAWRLGPHLLLAEGAEPPAWMAARPPLAAGAAELWRLRRGDPAAPGELNNDTNPFELGLADRVSLAKGCYVGQETLAKLATYDGVRRQLRRWISAGPLPVAPAAGDRLQDGSGERAGEITSALALDDGRWAGLALVRRQALGAAELRLADAAGVALAMSLPEAFVAPPVGAGRPSS